MSDSQHPGLYPPPPSQAVWWIRPHSMIFGFLLPVIGASVILARGQMHRFGMQDFLDLAAIALVVGSYGAMALGSLGGAVLARSYSGFLPRQLHRKRTEEAITALLLLSLVAHILLLGTIAIHPALIVSALSGQRGATYALASNLGRIPGVTTLTQLDLVALPLYGAFRYIFGRRPGALTTWLFRILMTFIAMRAFLASERIALIEALVCLWVPILVLGQTKRPKLLRWAPWIGLAGVLVLFAAGEYFRTWQFYKDIGKFGYVYSSYIEFVFYRFLGYIVTSTNNAIGVLKFYGSMGFPCFTAAWYMRLPAWTQLPKPHTSLNLDLYFAQFGNAEFNNPSGLLSPILDFGVGLGLALNLAIGTVSGWLYARFQQRRPLAIMLFPSFFVGILISNQAFYWADPRFLPVYLAVPIVLWYAHERQSRTQLSRRAMRQTTADPNLALDR